MNSADTEREDAMDSKLNDDELSALQSLDVDNANGGVNVREGDLPQRLFAFNLVTRLPSGTTVLTKGGERALFRYKCIAHLAALKGGEAPCLANGVKKWLLSSGFILENRAGNEAPTITQRGRLWLASFEKDADVVVPEVSASDFALRRA
jgi:hypothetical protein